MAPMAERFETMPTSRTLSQWLTVPLLRQMNMPLWVWKPLATTRPAKPSVSASMHTDPQRADAAVHRDKFAVVVCRRLVEFW